MVDTAKQALYIRVKVQHPSWSDELVQKEIERLQGEELAKDMQELFCKVNERKSNVDNGNSVSQSQK